MLIEKFVVPGSPLARLGVPQLSVFNPAKAC
jgi:hypothetical protein